MNDRTNPAESKAAHIGGWYVEVAANGERVLCISDDDVTGIDDMEPFAPIVRTAAAHLINFVGAGPSHVGALVALAHTLADTRPTDDELWDQTLSERDTYHEYADKLASAIATHLGVDIGEHSNLNNPWFKALEALESRSPAVAAEAVVIPAGYALVPIEPTTEMLKAGANSGGLGMEFHEWLGRVKIAWRHMLAAAPQPQVKSDGEQS